MSRARVLADYVSSGDELADKAPLDSPVLVTPNLGTPSAGVMTNMTGAVSASIGNDQIDSQHYAADSIDAEHYAPASVDTTAMAASVIGVKPHIIPDVLYPAVGGKLLDGTTSHGATYGVAQADGYSYYYTDIKGSKPIKDPRIGAHFGSQRHMIHSTQLLEQETATHGSNVYSIEGREWMRTVNGTTPDLNTQYGNALQVGWDDAKFYEIVGYFNDFNILGINWASVASYGLKFAMNGAAYTTPSNTFNTTSTSPLIGDWAAGNGRYLNMGSVLNLPITATLGINTIKITTGSIISGIELIAQDTDAADVNKIQIPSQNVVSYGKKFTVSGTPHYDPFNGFVNDTTLFASVVDMDTSLGLGTATTWGAAWDKGSSNHIRPYNGGRVVKWVASDGTIKTSVNMMPANAQNVSGTAAAEITIPSATNTYLPAMSNDAVDHSLAEVAKTFHWREFGNGSANGNASYLDVSTISATSDVAYVMDDGLTSFSGDDVNVSGYDMAVGSGTGTPSGDLFYITFIGTGLTVSIPTSNTTEIGTQYTIAQNLPYGTHIYKQERSGANGIHTLDGVVIATSAPNGAKYITFHQPKMPPIPEDAVVIADYMLMADFVKQTDAEPTQISKGVRAVSGSRDVFCDDTGSRAFYSDAQDSVNLGSSFWMGMATFYSHASTDTSSAQLPFFGTSALVRLQGSHIAHVIDFGGSTGVAKTALDNSVGEVGDIISIDSSATLGINTVKTTLYRGGYSFQGYDVASPIHTSSHYQTFETPFLHELVGGDRNMEQTNLVVTPDGKTWDEVTRDVGYIGNSCISAKPSVDTGASWADVLFDDFRGVVVGLNLFNKDFAIAYDRFICLKDGEYQIIWYALTAGAGAGGGSRLYHNSTVIAYSQSDPESGWRGQTNIDITLTMKRGDYFMIEGWAVEGSAQDSNHLNVVRI